MRTFHNSLPPFFADKFSGYNLQANELDAFARRLSIRRVAELRQKPIFGKFDLDHLCAIHAYIFQDVSTLAGSVRRYGLKRTDSAKPFARPWEIEDIFQHNVTRIVGKIQASADSDYFVTGCAHVFNAVNHAHPFCDGNGRSARELVETLANRRGLSFQLENMGTQHKPHWDRISEEGRCGKPQELILFFQSIVVPIPQDMHEQFGVVMPLSVPASPPLSEIHTTQYISPTRTALDRYLQKQKETKPEALPSEEMPAKQKMSLG